MYIIQYNILRKFKHYDELLFKQKIKTNRKLKKKLRHSKHEFIYILKAPDYIFSFLDESSVYID